MAIASDVPAIIDASTWLGDAAKAVGNYGLALRLCDFAADLADRFVRPFSAAWPTML